MRERRVLRFHTPPERATSVRIILQRREIIISFHCGENENSLLGRKNVEIRNWIYYWFGYLGYLSMLYDNYLFIIFFLLIPIKNYVFEYIYKRKNLFSIVLLLISQ